MRRDDPSVLLPSESALFGPEWSPEGVIELLEPLTLPARRKRLSDVIAMRLDSVTVLMDAPHDPHNGSAILRSADAFGVQTVHVVPRTEPFAISGNVAKGTERWVDVVRHPSADAAVNTLQNAGYRLVATHPGGELCPEALAEIPRLALVMGNEHDGISAALARAAEQTVRIPMRGFVESLNVSVSAAILLAFATRDRPGDCDAKRKQLLYAQGLFRSVSRAREVLEASRLREP